MGVTPYYADGKQLARVACDSCKTEVVLGIPNLHYPRNITPKQKKQTDAQVQTSRPVVQKMRTHGWMISKSKVVCKCCLKNREEDKMKKVSVKEPVTKVEPDRKSTMEQRRDIRKWLDEVYDVKNVRYKERYSDYEVADLCEGDVLWGWVKQIREGDYGENGGNEEFSIFAEEAKKLANEINAAIVDSDLAIKAFKLAYDEALSKLMKAYDGLQVRQKEVTEFMKKAPKL